MVVVLVDIEGFTGSDVLVNGVRLRVSVGGKPSKQAILLLHGHPENHLMRRRIVPTLAHDQFSSWWHRISARLRGVRTDHLYPMITSRTADGKWQVSAWN